MDSKETVTAVEEAAANAASGGPIRKLYDWCIAWADTPYATPALFVMSFAESSFFPIPPDVLQIALSVAKPTRSFFYAAVSVVGSVLGGVLGWVIGYCLWTALAPYFFDFVPGFTTANFELVRDWYHGNAFASILLASFTPIPYKIFTIASGVFHVGLPVLIVASLVGRSARFFLVAAVIYKFGPKVKEYIEKYFNIATVVMAILLVGGFVAIKYLKH
ncbi:YqaA family protein [Kolteria novifilia]